MPSSPLRLTRFQALKDVPKLLNNPLPVMADYLAKSDGYYHTFLGDTPAVITNRLDISLHVLKGNYQNYIKPPKTYGLLAKYLGNGLLTSEGERWKDHRKLLQPGFSPKRLASLAETMANETNAVFDLMVQKPSPIDWRLEAVALTSRIISRTIFGSHLSLEDVGALHDSIGASEKVIISQIRFPLSGRWFKLTGVEDRLQNRLAADRLYWLQIIAKRRDQPPSEDLLQMLLDAQYTDGSGMSDQDLLDEVITFFTAGHETSSHALSWFVYELGQRPDWQQQLYQEIHAVCDGNSLRWDQVSELPLLDSALRETLRLHPPAWIVDRQSIEAEQVGGYDIPADQVIAICIYHLQRNPDYWQQADQFVIDRFINSNDDTHEAWIPFGAGPRRCIGQHFAMMEMMIILAQLIQRLHFEVLNTHDIAPKVKVTMGIKNPLQVRFTAR